MVAQTLPGEWFSALNPNGKFGGNGQMIWAAIIAIRA
jgi:hypothetical protein